MRYKIWQAPFWAFFSTQFYRELGSNGKGVGFLYLLVLLCLASMVDSAKSIAYFQNQLMSVGSEYAEQLPLVQITDGKLSIDRDSPYYLQDPQAERVALAFDTSGTSKSTSDLDAPILVTEDAILARKEGSADFVIMKFAGIKQYRFTKADLLSILEKATWVVPIGQFFISVPTIWIGHIVLALAYSLAGLLLAKTISIQIKYEGILRIASIAIGNVVILDIISKLFPAEIGGISLRQLDVHWNLVKLLVGVGYTLFGVSANLAPVTFQSVSGDLPGSGDSLKN